MVACRIPHLRRQKEGNSLFHLAGRQTYLEDDTNQDFQAFWASLYHCISVSLGRHPYMLVLPTASWGPCHSIPKEHRQGLCISQRLDWARSDSASVPLAPPEPWGPHSRHHPVLGWSSCLSWHLSSPPTSSALQGIECAQLLSPEIQFWARVGARISVKWVNERGGGDNISQCIVSVKDWIPFLWLPQQITAPQVA